MKIEFFFYFKIFGENKMARLFLLLLIGIAIVPSFQSARHGFDPELLHVSNDGDKFSAPTLIRPEMFGEFIHGAAIRSKRDVNMAPSDTSSSKTSKDSTTPSNPSTVPLKKPAQMDVNDRTNLTTQTTNNITTMVNIEFRMFFFHADLFVCFDDFFLSIRKK